MLFWLWACGSDGGPPFYEAVVTHAPAVLPERFQVDVPAEWTEAAPPLGRLEHQLCAGAPGVRETAAQRIAEGVLPWTIAASLHCDRPDFCAFAQGQAQLEGASSPWWSALAGCSDEASRTLLEQRAPAGVLLSRALETGEITPRVREVALAQIRDAAGRPEHEVSAWLALAALGTGMSTEGGEQTEAALIEAHGLVSPEQRDSVALYLRTASTEPGRRLFRELCQRTSDPTCAWPEIDPLQDLAQAKRFGFDPERLTGRYPNHGAAVKEALARCASEAEPVGARRCVLALARLDRAAARKAASALRHEVDDLQELLAHEPEEVRAALAALELLPREGAPLPAPALHGRPPVTVPELLLAHGRALPLEEMLSSARERSGLLGESDHVRIFYALAELAGLQGVEFDQLCPSLQRVQSAPDGAFSLTWLAWMGHRRYRALQPLGAYDQGHQAVGFLNVLLAAAEREQRLAIADGIVLVGTPSQLQELHRRGWVRFEPRILLEMVEMEPTLPPGMVE